MKILVFDNYDSFTYNLVHVVEKILNQKVEIYRNDKIDLEQVNAYDKIILSPGPGIPIEAGLLLPLIQQYAPSKSILGVCLGHQAIAEAFGGSLINLKNVFHGIATPIDIIKNETGEMPTIFNGLPHQITVGRYHSWVVNENDLPEDLTITSRDENGLIMSMQHKNFDVTGVQFHPESVLTPQGETIIRNWLLL
jgi:anthranilate synthase component II